jgi:glutaredoxin
MYWIDFFIKDICPYCKKAESILLEVLQNEFYEIVRYHKISNRVKFIDYLNDNIDDIQYSFAEAFHLDKSKLSIKELEKFPKSVPQIFLTIDISNVKDLKRFFESKEFQKVIYQYNVLRKNYNITESMFKKFNTKIVLYFGGCDDGIVPMYRGTYIIDNDSNIRINLRSLIKSINDLIAFY